MSSEAPKPGKTPSKYRADLHHQATRIVLLGLTSRDAHVKISDKTVGITSASLFPKEELTDKRISDTIEKS